MGRHSMPEPEDSAAEPSDELTDDFSGSDDDTGRHFVSGPDTVGYPPQRPFARYADAARDDYLEDITDDVFDDVFDDVIEHGEPGGSYADEAGGDYPDSSRAGRSAVATPPSTGGGHRSQWRGGHRSEGGRRGVSIGVVAALVAVVVVVTAVILWRFFGDALSHRSHTAAGRCIAGKDTVAVIADPSIAEPVAKLAERYNATATPVGDRCVAVSVKSAGSDAVISGFVGNWPDELGPRPGLWIPGSSVSAARLTATAGQQTVTDSRSLVKSPVLLAVR